MNLDFSRYFRPGEDSIFYFLIFSSLAFFVVGELIRWRRFWLAGRADAQKGSRLEGFVGDPRAPLGWAIVPAIVLILLVGVEWKESSKQPPSKEFVAKELPLKEGALDAIPSSEGESSSSAKNGQGSI